MLNKVGYLFNLIRIMNCIKLALFFFICGVCFACSKKRSKVETDVPIYNIDYFSLSKSSLDNYILSKKVNYILLKDSGEKATFGRIDKIQIINSHIYLLDKRLRTLAVYNMEGQFIVKVGKRGQGPSEYINITDFTVDSLGNICVLDGTLDKVLFYNSDFQFVDEKKLPFEADILQLLDNEHLMFGLSSWNEGLNNGDKILITDLKLNVVDAYFRYDKYVDPAYWISDYQFAKTKYNIAYNQTISNDIAVFDHKGLLQEIIRLDFRDKNVPNRGKIDIESKLNDFDDYYAIKKIYAVTNDLLVGTLWESRKTKMFVIDKNTKMCYIGNKVNDLDRDFLCGFCDQGFISNIVETNEIYPDSVNKHLQLEGSVLKIQSIE